ncbi:oxidoreductase [Punctularia strigosozonata HHB-11173 SS5]|uniref:oxidoreductase n=1 Tax=Punctularia strigosozonata (strain HHB-11173) TaxID=741275 RepID=UPI0004417DDA|nr:oxidoreductase [Punctularia strigosozonata HHB-11173 SS5]EIN14016.1 oxidoreductase [Punctularia strigosozonata HHB-11173 SS5]
MNAQQRVVLVTGCSEGGIGFHLCEKFADAGCTVYATARKMESMDSLTHPNIHRWTLDVTSDEDIQKVTQTILRDEGRIDILVNNAGLLGSNPILDVKRDMALDILNTNVVAPIQLSRAVASSMAARGHGRIINIGSISGIIPTPWEGLYCASKAALNSITETLWMECHPLNVDVMLVTPGAVRSKLSTNASGRFALASDSLYKPYLDHIIARINYSQGRGSMPTQKMAEQVVTAALSKKLPRYITMGGNSTIVHLLAWFPRGLVLWLFWKKFSGEWNWA